MFGKKNKYIKLSDKQIKELEKKMTSKERKKFRKQLEQAEDDMLWDAEYLSILFDDDDL